MSSRPARIAMVVVGVLAAIVGGLWIGQGLGLIPGSVMSGDRTWFYVGIVVLVAGIILLVVGIRRARTP
ncbi:MAG TPA: hypothetical protein VFP34_03770 [Microlunatus sp.]|nr:hypothetical protein [Microlunatus sp.]